MAKAIWKARIKFFQNDVMSSLFLLSQLDIGAKYGPHWFNKNMQIDEARVSLEIVQSLIQSTAVTDNRFFGDCLREYRMWKYGDARGGIPESPVGLESALDGAYWSK